MVWVPNYHFSFLMKIISSYYKENNFISYLWSLYYIQTIKDYVYQDK